MHDKPKDKPDPKKLKQDLELLETALSDPLADSLLKETPRSSVPSSPAATTRKKRSRGGRHPYAPINTLTISAGCGPPAGLSG